MERCLEKNFFKIGNFFSKSRKKFHNWKKKSKLRKNFLNRRKIFKIRGNIFSKSGKHFRNREIFLQIGKTLLKS